MAFDALQSQRRRRHTARLNTSSHVSLTRRSSGVTFTYSFFWVMKLVLTNVYTMWLKPLWRQRLLWSKIAATLGCWALDMWLVWIRHQIEVPFNLNWFSFFSFPFYGCTCRIWKFQGLGLNWRCNSQPRPQTQQLRFAAASAAYAAACDHAGSWTHCARPGIKPTFSWMLCQVLNLLSHSGNSYF